MEEQDGDDLHLPSQVTLTIEGIGDGICDDSAHALFALT